MKKIIYKFRNASLFLSILVCSIANASNYYWVGNSGNWSDFATHWATSSGGNVFHVQVPQSIDTVYFDANSFTTSGQTVTVDQTIISCADMNWTNVSNFPNIFGTNANTIRIYGSLIFVTGMNVDILGPVSFESTTTGKIITMAGKTFGYTVAFNGIGGDWTLQDAFTASNTIYLNNGTFNSNNYPVTCSSFYSTTSTARTLNMGASIFTVTNISTIWQIVAAGMTVNSGTSVINATCDQSGWNVDFNGGGFTYYDLNFTGPDLGPSGYGDISDNNTFHNVTFASPGKIYQSNIFNSVTFNKDGNLISNNTYNTLIFTPGYTYTLWPGKTQTINNSFSATGNCGALINIKSNTAGTQTTISKASGVVNVSYVTLKDINATGGASFIASNAVDFGDNSGWTINLLAAQNLYWIGDGGNWSDGNHWSLTSGGSPSGCSPTPMDNVFFDANSFSSSMQTTLINIPTAFCNDMTWTNVTNSPSFTGTIANTLKIYGSLAFASGMTVNLSCPVSFEATTTGKTITSAGQSFSYTASFNGVGGGWTLLDGFTSMNTIYLNNGTFTSNNFPVSCNSFYSTTSTARTLNMGSSVFTITSISSVWQVFGPLMVVNAGTSTINATCDQSGWNVDFNGGGFTYYDLNFTGPDLGPSGYGDIGDNNTFHNVSFASAGKVYSSNVFNTATFYSDGTIMNSNTYNNLIFSPGYTYAISSGMTQTVNNSLSATGNCGALIAIKSNTSGTQTSISKSTGVINVSYVTLKDINATGGATFIASNAIDFGDNTGWAINVLASQNLYWIANGGNWSDGNHWSLTSGGAPSGCSPSPVDNVFFDANSFSSGSQSTIIDVPTAYCNNMTWTNVTNNPTFTGTYNNALKIYGSLTLASGMTLNVGSPVSFESTTIGKTISMAGKSFTNTATFNGMGGSWTLQDAFTTTNMIYLNNGTLTTNDFPVNCGSFYSTTTTARTLNMGASVFTVSNISTMWQILATGMTINSGTSTINATCNQSGWNVDFNGGGFTYHDLNFTGTLLGPSGYGDISDNNTFHNVSFASPGKLYANNIFNTVTFLSDGYVYSNNTYDTLNLTPSFTYTLMAGKTQTINSEFTPIGTGGFPIRIQSNTVGTPSTVYKASGQICADYIRVSDNIATGGATFNAGTNSQDLGGNTGWNFPGTCITTGVNNMNNSPEIASVNNIYPNPANDIISFDIYSPVNDVLNIQITNFTGRVVKDETETVSSGKSTINANINALSQGVYFINMAFEKAANSKVLKVTKLN